MTRKSLLLFSYIQKKSDYAGKMYYGMDWNRIIDEDIVREISTRIIGRVTQNEEKAYEAI